MIIYLRLVLYFKNHDIQKFLLKKVWNTYMFLLFPVSIIESKSIFL